MWLINGTLTYSSTTRANTILGNLQDILDSHPEIRPSDRSRFNPGIERVSATVNLSLEFDDEDYTPELAEEFRAARSQYPMTSGHIALTTTPDEAP